MAAPRDFGLQLDDELAAALQAVKHFGPASLDLLLDRIDEAHRNGAAASPAAVLGLLLACRGRRGFRQMRDLAEIFEDLDEPCIALLRAQAEIDTGRMARAVTRLTDLLPRLAGDGKLESEAMGLLGRAAKQDFVARMAKGDRDGAADALVKSAGWHKRVYNLDPAWHGANLAALAWRAEHEGIALDLAARDVGTKLEAYLAKALRDQQDKAPLARHDPWWLAALAQAKMAQGDWADGRALYAEYLVELRRPRHGLSAAFTIHGDLRQLEEIWRAGDGSVPEAEEIREMLRLGMARILAPDAAAQDGKRLLDALDTPGVNAALELQAIVAQGEIIPVEEMCRVLENRHAVAHVKDSDGSSHGTGFLMDGRPFGQPGPVFVTCHHVFADEKTRPEQIAWDDARLHFESWPSPAGPFRIAHILKTSPVDACDVTIATVEGLPSDSRFATLKTPAEQFLRPGAGLGPLGRVHPIGHPDKGPLSISLAGNEVVDHDLFRGPRGVRLLHYRANTRWGSSGSPVFGRSGHVVAVHHAAASVPLKGSRLQHPPPYAANEGVSIGSVIGWFQGP